jgi:transcriptional regulator NrdR family protein
MSDVPCLAYIYLLQDGKDAGTNIRKVGRTVQKGGDSRKLSRLSDYSKGTIVHKLWQVDENYVNIIENNIKSHFKDKYQLVRGTEWFDGDLREMKIDIERIVNEYEHYIKVGESTIVVETKNISERIKCEKCYKSFSRKDSFKDHTKICKAIKSPLQCYKCHKMLASKQSKCNHMKICKGEIAKEIVKDTATSVHNIQNQQNISNGTVNNNNVTINIHNFGEENLDHITNEVLDRLVKQLNDPCGFCEF